MTACSLTKGLLIGRSSIRKTGGAFFDDPSKAPGNDLSILEHRDDGFAGADVRHFHSSIFGSRSRPGPETASRIKSEMGSAQTQWLAFLTSTLWKVPRRLINKTEVATGRGIRPSRSTTSTVYLDNRQYQSMLESLTVS